MDAPDVHIEQFIVSLPNSNDSSATRDLIMLCPFIRQRHPTGLERNLRKERLRHIILQVMAPYGPSAKLELRVLPYWAVTAIV